MPRIAIVGSCITRDLWPIRGGGADNLLYISRTSFPSLIAAPVAGFQAAAEPPGDLHLHEHNACVADLRKTALARLVAYRPTHLILDLIDERFDLITVGHAVATHSAELERSGYLNHPSLQGYRSIPRLSAACDRLWGEALSDFAALVRATPLREARLILHSARWATEQRSPDGRMSPVRNVEIVRGHPVEIPPYNQLLERQEELFRSIAPEFERIGAERHHVADAAHRWGLSPFHYVPEYYEEIRSQLMALGLEDAFSAPLGAPSAPVA